MDPLPKRLSIALAATCLVPLLFPGDAPFINDEPNLISNAFLANQTHRLAGTGLMGNQGFLYGPLPTWIYQGFLLFTRDLVVIVALRALLVTAITGISLLWLCRTIRLWPWFLLTVMLSPYLWFYSRELWDNTFAIPLSALTFAAYLRFVDRESPVALAVVIACLWALSFTHLMSLALTVPIALHVIVARPRALWRHKWLIIATSGVAIWAGYAYCSYLLRSLPRVSSRPDLGGWAFPLLGPRYLSSFGLRYFFGSEESLMMNQAAGWVAPGSRFITLVAFPLTWVGIGIAANSVLHATRNRAFDTRAHAACLALAILSSQIILNGVTGARYHPHYYNATWIVFALFAWLTMDWLAKKRWAPAIAIAQAAGLATTIVLLTYEIHRNGGTREVYGPTLSNQIQVATQLGAYSSDVPLQLEVISYRLFPHALTALRLLQPPPSGSLQSAARLRIIYSVNDQKDGHIKLAAEALPAVMKMD